VRYSFLGFGFNYAYLTFLLPSQRKVFVAKKAYRTIKEAIAGCRRDLDLGMAILMVPDSEQFRVWISIPKELILKTE